MNIFSRLRRWIRDMLFVQDADIGKDFGVKLIRSDEMDAALLRWDNISRGRPPWLNGEDDIVTVNMAKHIADTRARLVTLDIGLSVSNEDGSETPSPRVQLLQEIANDLIKRLPEKVTGAERLGGMMFKWNGDTWDYVLPGNFGVTEKDGNGDITGAIFAAHAEQGDERYVRLEYHRFVGPRYVVTNKAYRCQVVGKKSSLGAKVPLKTVKAWAELRDEVSIENLDAPLFAYYRVPGANTIDPASPLGLSAFANAMEELKAVDVAFSRKGAEIEDSKHITFVGQTAFQYAEQRGVTLPRFMKALGAGVSDLEKSAIHERVPTLLTEERIKDINFDLSMAGVKCGFSEGVFVLDGQTGMITATQVEADDRDTIQTIKGDRDALKVAVERAMKGADAMVSLYGLAPFDRYKLDFNFGDITYNYEEDKANWKSYVTHGWVPKWRYFVKFEGMSEEEAKAMCAEADAAKKEPELFGVM